MRGVADEEVRRGLEGALVKDGSEGVVVADIVGVVSCIVLCSIGELPNGAALHAGR